MQLEYHSQIQKVISTLKEDLPTLFERDICYEIYTQDIYFQDPINKYTGKFQYRIIYWSLRFHAKAFFTKINFDLHDVHQSTEDTIVAKWTVRGNLRFPWKAEILFDGYSNYKLTPEGLIFEHIDTWESKPREILRQFLPKNS